GATFDLGDAGRHTDHHLRFEQPTRTGKYFADEGLQHLLGEVVIGDDAITHRPHGDDVAGGAAEHAIGLFTDGFYLAGISNHSDNRGLPEEYPLAFDIDQHGGSTEVDPDLLP